MAVGSEIHRRRSIRLEGYDYSLAGAYFVTVYPGSVVFIWQCEQRADDIEPGRSNGL